MRSFLCLFLYCISLLLALPLNAQSSLGYPIISTYNPDSYGAEVQNWAVAQNKGGLLYVGNRHQVLEFDGINWSKIPLPNKYVVRSLQLGNDGILYVGGTDEFGYLGKDSLHQITFISLKHLLPENFPNFKDIWTISILEQYVIFQSRNYLFVYDGNTIKVIKAAQETFQYGKAVNGKMYLNVIPSIDKKETAISTQDYGLYEYDPHQEQLIFTGYASTFPICGILPWKNEQLLITSKKVALAVFDPQTKKSQTLANHFTPVIQQLSSLEPYSSIYLPDGRISISTLKNGLYLIDPLTGEFQVINQSKGLIGNTVYQQFIDQYGNLWLAQEQGLSYLRLQENLQQYGATHGLDGTSISSAIFNNRFFVGTTTGVYQLMSNQLFERLAGAKDQTWQFFDNHQALFAIQNRGYVAIQQQKANYVVNAEPWTIIPLKKHPGLWLAGNYNAGLSILKAVGDQLQVLSKVKGFQENSRKIVEDLKGNIWVSDKVLGVWKLRLTQSLDSVEVLHFFEGKDDFPAKAGNYVFDYQLDKHSSVLFGTTKGFYHYDQRTQKIEEASLLNQALGNIGDIRNAFAADNEGNLCFIHRKDFVILRKQEDGSFLADSTSLAALKGQSSDQIQFLENGKFCITTNEGVFFVDPKQPKPTLTPFSALIRTVQVAQDLVFGGVDLPTHTPQFQYHQNTLAFTFSAPYFSEKKHLTFQYKLEGFDNKWSEWSQNTFKEYTNIPEGTYTFLVKARNFYGQESQVASYRFEVLAPWYRSYSAYFVYLLSLLGLIWLGIRINTYRLQRENERLEQIIQERTAEIQEQKEEIQIQSEEILTQNESLSVQKDALEGSYEKILELNTFQESMAGMIVHDLKNPLNAIIGLSTGDMHRNKLNSIHQSGKQMLHLVSNILDVYKFEQASIQLHLEVVSLTKIVQEALSQVQLLLDDKSIQVNSSIGPAIHIIADREIIARVLINLLTNSIKYTPIGGEIRLSTNDVEQFCHISITDTGTGIPADKLDTIFDKFAQAGARDSGRTRSTGLGLTFCKMAIEAHGGEIGVSSQEGKGATFSFSLPLSSTAHIFIEDQLELLEIKNSLSNMEQERIRPYLDQLQTLKLYEVSKLNKLLKSIDSAEQEALADWKYKLKRAAFQGNHTEYNRLLKLVD